MSQKQRWMRWKLDLHGRAVFALVVPSSLTGLAHVSIYSLCRTCCQRGLKAASRIIFPQTHPRFLYQLTTDGGGGREAPLHTIRILSLGSGFSHKREKEMIFFFLRTQGSPVLPTFPLVLTRNPERLSLWDQPAADFLCRQRCKQRP